MEEYSSVLQGGANGGGEDSGLEVATRMEMISPSLSPSPRKPSVCCTLLSPLLAEGGGGRKHLLEPYEEEEVEGKEDQQHHHNHPRCHSITTNTSSSSAAALFSCSPLEMSSVFSLLSPSLPTTTANDQGHPLPPPPPLHQYCKHPHNRPYRYYDKDSLTGRNGEEKKKEETKEGKEESQHYDDHNKMEGKYDGGREQCMSFRTAAVERLVEENEAYLMTMWWWWWSSRQQEEEKEKGKVPGNGATTGTVAGGAGRGRSTTTTTTRDKKKAEEGRRSGRSRSQPIASLSRSPTRTTSATTATRTTTERKKMTSPFQKQGQVQHVSPPFSPLPSPCLSPSSFLQNMCSAQMGIPATTTFTAPTCNRCTSAHSSREAEFLPYFQTVFCQVKSIGESLRTIRRDADFLRCCLRHETIPLLPVGDAQQRQQSGREGEGRGDWREVVGKLQQNLVKAGEAIIHAVQYPLLEEWRCCTSCYCSGGNGSAVVVLEQEKEDNRPSLSDVSSRASIDISEISWKDCEGNSSTSSPSSSQEQEEEEERENTKVSCWCSCSSCWWWRCTQRMGSELEQTQAQLGFSFLWIDNVSTDNAPSASHPHLLQEDAAPIPAAIWGILLSISALIDTWQAIRFAIDTLSSMIAPLLQKKKKKNYKKKNHHTHSSSPPPTEKKEKKKWCGKA